MIQNDAYDFYCLIKKKSYFFSIFAALTSVKKNIFLNKSYRDVLTSLMIVCTIDQRCQKDDNEKLILRLRIFLINIKTWKLSIFSSLLF